jgi:hypothetical protein
MSDVRVHGLVMGSVLIEDISVDVPQGVTVVIPAEKSAKSKDLWRLVAQKRLFRLGPQMHSYPTVATVTPNEADHLREENRLLLEQNALLRQAISAQGGKLDAILGLLESGKFAPSNGVQAKPTDLVNGDAPTYIPTEIKPTVADKHIEVKSETSAGSGVAGAGAALRKLRKGTPS